MYAKYAKGMTTKQISETIEDIYGFETSENFISDVTDKIMPQIEDWHNLITLQINGVCSIHML